MFIEVQYGGDTVLVKILVRARAVCEEVPSTSASAHQQMLMGQTTFFSLPFEQKPKAVLFTSQLMLVM